MCIRTYRNEANIKPYLFLDAELDRLVTDLKPVATEWESLGIELEVEGLEEIGALFTGQGGKVQLCLRKVVLDWLNNSTKPATRDVLKKALEAVGHKRRANDLPTGLLVKGLGLVIFMSNLHPKMLIQGI